MHGGDTCSKDFLMNNGSSVRTTSRAVESFAEQELQHVTSARATTCRLYISVWIWIEPEARSMFFCELQSLMSYVPLPYCLNGIMQRHKFDTNDLGMIVGTKANTHELFIWNLKLPQHLTTLCKSVQPRRETCWQGECKNKSTSNTNVTCVTQRLSRADLCTVNVPRWRQIQWWYMDV